MSLNKKSKIKANEVEMLYLLLLCQMGLLTIEDINYHKFYKAKDFFMF